MNIIKDSGVPGLYKIKDGKGLKTKFVSHIKTLKKAEYFKNFIPLFETIDDISGISEYDYTELI